MTQANVVRWMLIVLVSEMSQRTLYSQATTAVTSVPDWALPGSKTHKQVPPPADFHRTSLTTNKAVGIFKGESDIGSAVVPGSDSYDAVKRQYTIRSAGYNIWYSRDEFRFLFKKMSGDVSLAADIQFPDATGYGDRKAVLVIRQNLDDDSKEAMVALHGAGMIHIAQRAATNAQMTDMEYRMGGPKSNVAGFSAADEQLVAKRIGIEKLGDTFTLFVSEKGEPMHEMGLPIQLHIDGPFYVGIGFCSHIPDKPDTAVLSNVVLENVARKVR